MLRRVFAVFLTLVAILAAGWLALRRADIPYDTLEATYSLRDSQFMTLQDGLKVHYTDTGPRDRSVIVLVHGFAASLHTWDAWRRDLESDYRVITLDLPGHGLTRADPADQVSIERFSDVVLETTATLGADRFTLAGNSMGGNTAWVTALRAPERVDGLVLLNASGWPETEAEREAIPLVFRLLSNPFARSVMKDLDMTSLIRDGLEQSYTDQSFVTDELVARYGDLSRAPGHRQTLLTLLSTERAPATPERLSAIRQPTLILWGRNDNLVPVAHAAKFAEAIEGAEAIVYETIGHLPQEEAAVQSLADLRVFMDKVEFSALDDEFIIPAGDPRLVDERGQSQERD